MTLGECFENKWFYMKYIRKYLCVEKILPGECSLRKLSHKHTLCIFLVILFLACIKSWLNFCMRIQGNFLSTVISDLIIVEINNFKICFWTYEKQILLPYPLSVDYDISPPVHITTNVVSLNPAHARCTRYNIMW